MSDIKDILRNAFVTFVALFLVFAIYGILTEPNPADIAGLLISARIIYWIYQDQKRLQYPHKWFATSLGMFALFGVLIWLVIRPDENYKSTAKRILGIIVGIVVLIGILIGLWYITSPGNVQTSGF